MSLVGIDFGIDEALAALGIKDVNEGTSTGSNNFSSGLLIESYSPVDGALIGKVRCTSKADFEKVVRTAASAFEKWRSKPAPQR
ncbi:MAG TPA: aldehyde dehydrogenase family protein, partial [Eudoraea sp.]|nr:aldehyde dehydrogenase family protein [Eudoraea sp.]